jgi:hypothetical protein
LQIEKEEGTDFPRILMCKMACGRVLESPIAKWELEAKSRLEKLIPRFRTARIKRLGEVHDLELSVALARHLGDPFQHSVDRYLREVRVGLGHRLPRNPAVWPRKTRWNVKDSKASAPQRWAENYRSALGQIDLIKRKFTEQRESKQLIQMTFREARARWGDRLFVAAIAALEQGPESWRIVHDGTHYVMVNAGIVVRDQVLMPMACDIRAIMAYEQHNGGSRFAIGWDAEGAHRTISVHEDDWGVQACTLEADITDDTLIDCNTVGTYGIASAAFWWALYFAWVLRLMPYVSDPEVLRWMLAFADDSMNVYKRGLDGARVPDLPAHRQGGRPPS